MSSNPDMIEEIVQAQVKLYLKNGLMYGWPDCGFVFDEKM